MKSHYCTTTATATFSDSIGQDAFDEALDKVYEAIAGDERIYCVTINSEADTQMEFFFEAFRESDEAIPDKDLTLELLSKGFQAAPELSAPQISFPHT